MTWEGYFPVTFSISFSLVIFFGYILGPPGGSRGHRRIILKVGMRY